MKRIKLLLRSVFLTTLCISCIDKEFNVAIEHWPSENHIKFEVGRKQKDSSLLGVFIPQKLKIENKSSQLIKFTNPYRSIGGGNTLDGLILLGENDSIAGVWNEYSIVKGGEEQIDVYVRYKAKISNEELDNLIQDGRVVQKRLNRNIYETLNNKTTAEFFNKKIPDSLKGYIHLNFINPKTEYPDYLNIPIEF
ncbi:hypothetical protein Q4566_02975 [Tamlana sp. 2_MG-2023]|uniref:hypothetical protein n=1 Tax=unclassified Tamlana TaxID=2614803 RepID=UPI0026E1E312|nr:MULTISPECIES: hypothetical protein [unclassified Tamlana]MDO6759150.1 hypothetical protein [Tamlana sp. 2_MG-2023]MDO6789849.1 hypothetical protein [Tamlana sp. 1_MG-2023]